MAGIPGDVWVSSTDPVLIDLVLPDPELLDRVLPNPELLDQVLPDLLSVDLARETGCVSRR